MRKSLSNDSEFLIDARGLRKSFGAVTALDGLDLQVRPGEVHGFLGPNGAGKTTAIRAILGQLRLDDGSLSVFGAHPVRDLVAIHQRLCYVPGDTSLWPGLTGGECIDLLGRLQGRQDRRRRDELIERFELDPTRRARGYSKGNRQKVALIAALCTRAELLLLDEPTSGLDPLMENEFQKVIREGCEQECTVLLSSHLLDQVEELCDRVTIVRSGRTVSTGSLEDLRSGTRTVIETTTGTGLPGLEAVEGVTDVTRSPVERGVHTRLVARPDAVAAAMGLIAAAGPSSLVVRPPSLEELFLDQYVSRS